MKFLTLDVQSTAVEAIHELLLQNSFPYSAIPKIKIQNQNINMI